MIKTITILLFTTFAFAQVPLPNITIGPNAPAIGLCTSVRVGDIYVRSEDAANAPISVHRCTQVGAQSLGAGAYQWQLIGNSVGPLPATCVVGDVAFQTSAVAGSNLYGCTATNTWTVQTGAAATNLWTRDATNGYIYPTTPNEQVANVGSNNASGVRNNAIGSGSLTAIVGGSNNTAMGFEALKADTNGNTNTGFGYRAVTATTTGSNNVGIGPFSLNSNTTTSDNVSVGVNSMYFLTTGGGNAALGHHAGQDAIDNTNGTFLGNAAGVTNGLTAYTFNTALGAASKADCDNCIVLGRTGDIIKGMARAFSAVVACAAGLEGAMAPITDSSTATWGATITGSGSNHVLGYCNGTNWTVFAK